VFPRDLRVGRWIKIQLWLRSCQGFPTKRVRFRAGSRQRQRI